MNRAIPDRSSIIASHRLSPDAPAGFGALVLAAVISAVAFILAFPPVSFWPAIVFAPAALGWLSLTAPSTRAAVTVTYVTHLALWLWLSYWLTQITTAGYPFYAAYLSIYPALFVWVVRRIHTTRSPALLSSLPLTITLPLIWVGLETLRGELAFNGYPWFLLAHPLIDAPELVQSADLFGTYFISFLAAMISGALLDVMRYRQRLIEMRTLVPIVGFLIIIHAANMTYGYWRISQTEPLEPGPVMLPIQTNLPQDNKMRSTLEERIEQSELFIHQTIASMHEVLEADQQLDLVIWPETMVFGYGLDPQTLRFLSQLSGFRPDWNIFHLRAMQEQDIQPTYSHLSIAIASTLHSVVEESSVPMLVGSPAYIGLDVDEEGRWTWDELYNAAYLIDGERPYQRYDKHFLTPFGETMPYISKWPWLERRLLDLGARGMTFDLDAGEGFNRLAMPWNGRTIHLATPICFEVTMSRTCRRLAGAGTDERADVFINLSNDGWFGWYDAGRTQHAQIARFRSIEHRTPMVRAVNTGLSMSIDSLGRITHVIGEGPYGSGQQPGALLVAVTLDSRQTLYTVIGNAIAWIALILTVFAFASTFVRRQGAAYDETPEHRAAASSE